MKTNFTKTAVAIIATIGFSFVRSAKVVGLASGKATFAFLQLQKKACALAAVFLLVSPLFKLSQVEAQCTSNCQVDAGPNKTSVCPGNNIQIGVSSCTSGGASGCTRNITWTPSNLVVSGQGTCQPTVNPTVTTKFYINVWMHGNCCCSGASGSCSTSSCDSVLKKDSMTVTVNSSGCRLTGIAVNKEIENSGIRIYPNPSSGKITINLSEEIVSGKNKLMIALYDVNGKLLYSNETKEKETEINLSAMPKGNYFIQVTEAETTLCLKKIIYN